MNTGTEKRKARKRNAEAHGLTTGDVSRFRRAGVRRRRITFDALVAPESDGGGSCITRHLTLGPRPSTLAFTLIELLVVIAIIGILAAVALPSLHNLKPNPAVVAVNQLRDDVGRARQLAIANHTTVYMIFAPSNFWADTDAGSYWTPRDWANASRLYDKQTIAYTFVALRSVGDQPGGGIPHYLSAWRTLPEGAFIPLQKFGPANQYLDITSNGVSAFKVYGFNTITNVPFPTEDATIGPTTRPYVNLPYIAFNYLGQLVSGVPPGQSSDFIPVARGSVVFSRDQNTKQAKQAVPSVQETPPGNATNSFNLVSIDPLTGRAHIEQPRIQ